MIPTNQIKIAFLGGGNMASAIISGLIKQGFEPQNLLAIDPLPTARNHLTEQFNIRTATDLSQCGNFLDVSQLLVLCVKPQQLLEAILQLKNSISHLTEPKLLTLSIVAGVRITDIAKQLGHSRIVRAMPNTPALIQKGITGLFAGQHVNQQDIDLINIVCKSIGASIWVSKESLLDAVTAISGSGPAYVFAFLEAMQSAGEKLGLDAQTARQLAYATLEGATQLAHNSDEHAGILRERVTSKGGTTAAALEVMQQHGWHEILEKAIDAASQRGKTMGDELGKN